MKNILVPTDFSKEAGYALQLATDFAKKTGAKLSIIHVIEYYPTASFTTMGPAPESGITVDAFTTQMIKKVEKQFEELKAKEMFDGVDVQTFVKIGNPYQNITKKIAALNADLVIMGSKGAHGMDEVMIGSNAERVVRYSKHPVITVKEPIRLDGIKSIAFATDYTEAQVELLSGFDRLLEVIDAEVYLLRVNTPYNFIPTRGAENNLREFAKKNHLVNVKISTYDAYKEDAGISAFAQDNNIDLIAIGTHGRKGIMHTISGSIAEDLVNHTAKPVWTCHIK
ncbi:universal stress protein [Marinigracilibium pacificum]|uniref:Universal stress protein n=1 Tax=Marinigracilibium pacificum TaxID=2729599 RepID=A0A848IR81_9BACT|nr:universal stress protein [Marinigracilibium pacificum]NMM46973.1 universal stress protein [Marinigracilibium pacificum]